MKDSPDFDYIPYMPFTDYKTGTTYSDDKLEDGQLWTKSYWKPMSKVLEEYIKHPEAKSEGDENTTGFLERRHIFIDDTSIVHIGKETNELEEAMVIGADPDNYTEYTNWKRRIESITTEQADKAGISRRNLSYLKQKAKNNEPISLKSKTRKKLLKLFK